MLAAAAPQLSVDRLRSSSGTVDRRSRSLIAAADTGVTREPRSRHSSKGTFAEPTVVRIYGSGTGASAIAFTSTLRRNTFAPGLIMIRNVNPVTLPWSNWQFRGCRVPIEFLL